MKNKASVFLKQVLEMVKAVAKAKSTAVKSKASALKTRLLMFSLIKNKKLVLGSISHKIHALLAGNNHDDHHLLQLATHPQDPHHCVVDDGDDQSKAIVLYGSYYDDGNDDDDKYPDLRHSLFDLEEEFDDPGGSIIDLVKNSKDKSGQDFSLEDEIDHVADLFIMRVHKQMRLQKLQSFKRLQEMLQRGA